MSGQSGCNAMHGAFDSYEGDFFAGNIHIVGSAGGV